MKAWIWISAVMIGAGASAQPVLKPVARASGQLQVAHADAKSAVDARFASVVETKAAMFDNTTAYLEFIEQNPHIHVVAVTPVTSSELLNNADWHSAVKVRTSQIIVTYEESR